MAPSVRQRKLDHSRVVLQFAYATVLYDWPFLEATVLDVIAKHAPIRTRSA